VSGPFHTEREARATVQHILASPPGTGAWGDGCHRLLEDACAAAGVTLGAYDHRILLWLAGWEPATCAVVADLVIRAAAGRLALAQLPTMLAALEDAATLRTERANAYCLRCSEHPSGACDEHLDDLDAAKRYRQMAQEIEGQR
jgi:hypothetical protein